MVEALRDLYFFGKLKKHRDFIESTKLQLEDKRLLQMWFQQCSHTNLRFAGKIRAYMPVWLFATPTGSGILYGLASPSQDAQGRLCPFIVFGKTDCSKELLASLSLLFQQNVDFSRSVATGIFSEHQLSAWCCLQHHNYETSLPDSFNIDWSEKQDSVWFECRSHQCIEATRLLSCSLFNKLFG